MKFLALLFLLLAPAAQAATPSGASVISVGSTNGSPQGQALIELACASATTGKCFSLYSGVQSSTAGGHYHFYKDGVPYQVGASVKAYCFAITYSSASGGSSGFWQFASATNNFTDAQTAGSLTGAKWQTGVSGNYISSLPATINTPAPFSGIYVFDASSYPAYQANVGGVDYHFAMTCYEK